MNKVNVKDVVHEKCVRKTFAKIGDSVDIPNLIQVQKDSYDWFIKEGLGEVLEDTRERLESGELTIDDGHLVIGDEIDLTRLREIAERYHKEPQEVLNGLLERAIG